MPLTFEQFKELRNKGLNTEQIISFEKGKKPEEITTPQTFSEQQLDRTIANRPDLYKEAVQATAQRLSPEGMRGFTLPQEVDIALKSIGGVAQRAEAAVANPFLRKQGKFQNPIKAIKEGITGEQLGELGDVVRQAPLVNRIPFAPEIIGLAGTGAIGGALTKSLGLASKANNLTKLETTYGKDMARVMIRHSTELPMPLVERGIERGWKNILTKENAKDFSLPNRISNYVIDSLDKITQNEYDEFGKALSNIKTGNVKAIDLNQVIEDALKSNGYIDEAYRETLKSRGAVVNKIVKFIETAQSNNIQPNDNIPIDVIQTFKKILKNFVPEKNWLGKTRSLKGEQRLAKELSNRLDDLIAYNSYGIEDEAYTKAKVRYSEFKNFEKAIMDTFSGVFGQEIRPSSEKIVTLAKQNPSTIFEEMNKLKNIDDFLIKKGYKGVSDNLLDWITTQEALLEPRGGFFQYVYERPLKYLSRQYLKSGYTEPVGKAVETTGKLISPTRKYINRKTTAPILSLGVLKGVE
jgi:hypothetical protein